MRKPAFAIVIILSVAAASAFYAGVKKTPSQQTTEISPITFQEVDRMVRSRLSNAKVEECSQRLQGTRVRWSGTVTGIDDGQTVYIATNIFPTNVQFNVSMDIASGLRRGQAVEFVGTLERVLDAETAPPMFHTYVVLKDVELERSAHK